jgi:hypothetical protein
MKWIGQHIYDQISRFRNDVFIENSDLTIYRPINDDPAVINLGSSATERLEIKANYASGTQEVNNATFKTYTESTTGNRGRFVFSVDETTVVQVMDAGLNLGENKGLQINNTNIITDSSGTATLSNIDGLDSTTTATLTSVLGTGGATTLRSGMVELATTAETTTGTDAFRVVTPDGLKDGYQGSANVTTLGTIASGIWQGDVIASTYLDSDTAHLTTNQIFTGTKTFSAQAIFDASVVIEASDGAVIHQDSSIITDSATSASGTAALTTVVNIEGARLHATNSSVTTTNAASLYIKAAPVAGTNQTITNAYALLVEDGLVKFDGALTVGGTITGTVGTATQGTIDHDSLANFVAAEHYRWDNDISGTATINASNIPTLNQNTTGSSGSCTGQAATVATIAGLAPNTATTQATQPNITSIGTDGDNLMILGDSLQMFNASTNSPIIKLVNNTDDAAGPILQLWNQRLDSGVQVGEDGDTLGNIDFWGYNDAGTPGVKKYAGILSAINDATAGEESGQLSFTVASHDGDQSIGLTLTGGSEDNEVDIAIGSGAASLTTVAGDLSITTGLILDGNDITGVDDSDEFTDDDAHIMTSAAVEDRINTKYSTSYITFSVKSSSTYGTNYILMHGNGISGGLVNIDSGTDSAGDFGGVTTEEGGSGADATCDVATGSLEQQIPIPETCKLMGFYATASTTTNTGTAYDIGVAMWHVPEANINWGASVAGEATLIHKSDSSRHAENTSHGGGNRKKVQLVKRMDGTAKTLAAGDILIPSLFGETSNQQVQATITLVIATPIKTI